MIQFQNVQHTYGDGSQNVQPLLDVSFEIQAGEFVSISGASGAGKSTLLMIAGGLLTPTAGQVTVAGTELNGCSHSQRNRFRAQKIGFVFQMFHLVPYLDVRENIQMGQLTPDRTAVEKIIERLGLSHRAQKFPSTLSAGEQQRTALARAMIHQPPVILADEPTGNLDPENADQVLKLLDEYRKEGGTVLAVSHGADIAEYADRILTLKEGTIHEPQINY